MKFERKFASNMMKQAIQMNGIKQEGFSYLKDEKLKTKIIGDQLQ
jgi:hypothetical protein